MSLRNTAIRGVFTRLGQCCLASLCIFMSGGCLSPIALNHAMVAYDRHVVRAEKELLLLNIARVEDHQPPHFTLTSSIAATFDFRANTGFTARLLEAGGTPLNPNSYTLDFGTSVAESPTISIIPIQGEEFTQRLLTPLDAEKFKFLLLQGKNLQMLFRLIARGIEVEDDEHGPRVYLNTPREPDQYEQFRRIVLHLDALQARHELYLLPLDFHEEVAFDLPQPLTSMEILQALSQGYQWIPEDSPSRYRLRKPIRGRLALTNYPGERLSNDEREAWNRRVASLPPNVVLVDIRPAYPGGAFSFRGHFRLRSFHEMLAFLGEGIRHYPEFLVEPDPRTGPIRQNPTRTLAIGVGTSLPAEASLGVDYRGETFWIGNLDTRAPASTSWDLQAFSLLYQIFQMTVTDVSKVLTPGITIAK